MPSIYASDDLLETVMTTGAEVLRSYANPDDEAINKMREVATPAVVIMLAVGPVEIVLNRGKNPLEVMMQPPQESGVVPNLEFIAQWLYENPEVQARIMADPRWKRSI